MWVNTTVNTQWIAHRWVQLILCKSHLTEVDFFVFKSAEGMINFYWKMEQDKAQDSLILRCALVATSQRGVEMIVSSHQDNPVTLTGSWQRAGHVTQQWPVMWGKSAREDFCPHLPWSGRRCCLMCCCCSGHLPPTIRGQENFRVNTHSGLAGSQKQPWTGSSPFCHPTQPHPSVPKRSPNIPQLAQLQWHWPVGDAERDQSHE